jgi:arylsulfatase A-like enzyme
VPLATAIDAVAAPNVVLFIMDDVGIEHIEDFGVGQGEFARTPHISDFEEISVRFDDAWSTPLCSSTRPRS